jgi:SPP1 gp7 family putative phage head morphogenesis protein
MPTTALTPAERRHRAAIVRAARMGGALAGRIRSALSVCVDGLPERLGPHDLLRVRAHVETAVELMRRVLGERFRQMLMAAAEREHFLTAVELTRASRRGRKEEAWTDYLRLIIPAPALDFLEQIVGPLWRRVVGAINPERASNAVLQGIASGKDRRQIAADLTEVFDGYDVAARRVARTAGLEVATRTQLAVSEQIPDLVSGYELNTVLDDRVRPEHRAAHGRRFYRVPKDGQLGMDQMPVPPVWNGQVHFNCRCMLIPIIEIDGEEV